ncbi:MAG: response regulator transcription factor [Dehalococcoidia bacterium]|nr:response regulator transcription factor [Dehalococcoidia bacterium]
MTKIPKVLLIDDDPDFVEATRIVLESKPYEVIVAYDGDDGLRKARDESPDLIILDVIMPVKDGFSTAEQLKKNAGLKNIPVIMLTSYAEKGSGSSIAMSGGLAMETEDYIDKPVTPEELLKKVEKYLKRAGPDVS